METTGRYLTDLAQDMADCTCSKAAITIFDDKACVNWCPDGTLAFFDPDDGYPDDYWLDGHPAPHDNREEYTDFDRFVARLNKYATTDRLKSLLASPVWCVIDTVDENGASVPQEKRVRHLRLVK